MKSVMILIMGMMFMSAAAQDPILTLDEIFQRSLTRAQTVNIQSELMHQANDQYQQARAGLLPQLDGVGTYTAIDPNLNMGQGNPNQQPMAKLTLTQNIFRGFQDISAMNQNQTLERASKFDRDAAMVQLYKDVAQAYYAVVMAEGDLDNFNNEIKMYQTRIAELKTFERKGRSRISEVLTAQSGMASLKAQTSQTEGQLAASRVVLQVMAGLPDQFQLDKSDPADATRQDIQMDLKYIESRPEVVASKVRNEAFDQGVEVARAGHFPSVDFNGNYYLYRTGTSKDSHWDALLSLTVPIYSGGMISSKVAEAVSKKQQNDDALIQSRMAAEQEIKTVSAAITYDIKQIENLKSAAELAKKSYEYLSNEYRLGLETNVDVLTALQAYQEAERSLDHTRNTLKWDRIRYLAALGLKGTKK